MHYLCLAYGDTAQWEGMSHQEQEALLDSTRANEAELRQRGHLVVAEPLANSAATVVCVQGGEVSLQDGPLLTGRYQLVGWSILQARDLNQAIHLAAQMPHAQVGAIEIWPVAALDQLQQTT